MRGGAFKQIVKFIKTKLQWHEMYRIIRVGNKNACKTTWKLLINAEKLIKQCYCNTTYIALIQLAYIASIQSAYNIFIFAQLN